MFDCLKKPEADVYRVLLANSPGAVVIKDGHDKILWCNDKALRWFKKDTVDEVKGHSPTKLWPIGSQENSRKFYDIDKDIMENGQSRLDITEIVEIDGKDHLLRIDKIQYRDSKGIVSGVVTFILDMTESLEMHILKYNSDIVYHELRAGLGNIIAILKNQEERHDSHSSD